MKAGHGSASACRLHRDSNVSTTDPNRAGSPNARADSIALHTSDMKARGGNDRFWISLPLKRRERECPFIIFEFRNYYVPFYVQIIIYSY